MNPEKKPAASPAPAPAAPTPAAPPVTADVPRRNFLVKAAAAACGGLVALIPLASGILFFLDPLRKRGSGGDYIKVADLASLPSDGQPMKFSIISDKVDCWNRFPNQPIGAVYVSRTGPDAVTVFNVTCPHLGCAVDYRAAENCYHCPCHDSRFNPAGTPENMIPPRGLDSLEVDSAKLAQGEVWVKFQNFMSGLAEKTPKT